MAPSQLIWQLVKNNNAFLHKGLNGSQFSAEPGNLYNVNSYKYSGLANEKTVHIGGSDDGCLSVTKTMPKNSQKPKSFKVKVTKKGKNFRRTAARLQKDVHAFRPDLKKAALARAYAVNKSHHTAHAAANTTSS